MVGEVYPLYILYFSHKYLIYILSQSLFIPNLPARHIPTLLARHSLPPYFNNFVQTNTTRKTLITNTMHDARFHKIYPSKPQKRLNSGENNAKTALSNPFLPKFLKPAQIGRCKGKQKILPNTHFCQKIRAKNALSPKVARN